MYNNEHLEGFCILTLYLYLPNTKEVKFQPIFWSGIFFRLASHTYRQQLPKLRPELRSRLKLRPELPGHLKLHVAEPESGNQTEPNEQICCN